MATNLAIDSELLDRAVEVSGERTKKAVVTKALQEFIARRQQRRIVLGLLQVLQINAPEVFGAYARRHLLRQHFTADQPLGLNVRTH